MAVAATDETPRLRSAPVTELHTARSRLSVLAAGFRTAAAWSGSTVASAVRWLATGVRDVAVVGGPVALIAAGCWLLHPAAGLIVGGVLLLAVLLVWQLALRPQGMVVPLERLVVMLASARAGMTDAEILPGLVPEEPEVESGG